MQIEAGTNPFTLFDSWYKEAVEAEINDPDAIALASVNADGMPSVRMVPVSYTHLRAHET